MGFPTLPGDKKVRASSIMTDTFIGILAVFTLAYSYLLYRGIEIATSSASLTSTVNMFMYLSIQAVFLSLVLYMGFVVVRTKDRPKGSEGRFP